MSDLKANYKIVHRSNQNYILMESSMNKKLQTQLMNFRFNSIIQKWPIHIEWFRYDLNEDLEERVSGLSETEAHQLSNFAAANSINFDGGKQHQSALDEDIPFDDIFDYIPDERQTEPDYFLLVPKPKLSKGIANWMPIILTDANGNDKHNYDLPFGLVGRIIR